MTARNVARRATVVETSKTTTQASDTPWFASAVLTLNLSMIWMMIFAVISRRKTRPEPVTI